jgi:hypothetical protein
MFLLTKFSKAFLVLVLFSIIVNISLAQNYTQSLIPEVNDGIGISNDLAYWAIGEGGWSIEQFRTVYNGSTTLSIILVIVYAFILVFEKRK